MPTSDAPPPEEVTVPPYTWMESNPPNSDVLRLWAEVAQNLEKHQTGEFGLFIIISSMFRLDPCFRLVGVICRASFAQIFCLVFL
jgi:hypothetical protein